jgi:hypothetical protein
LKRIIILAAIAALAAAACQEKLASPTECPELCPGNSLDIREVALLPIVGADSTYTGYLSASEITALLVSDGIDAGEARSFASFPKQSDSTIVDGVTVPYTTDSVAIVFTLLARDSTVLDLKLFLHRVSPSLDTTSTFADVDGALTPASLIDSLVVPDTLRRGLLRLVVTGETLARLVPAEGDSGRIGIGVRIRAAEPTGVRLATATGTDGVPGIITYAKAAVTDTAKQRLTLTRTATAANYVITAPPAPGPESIFMGGRHGSRALIRFSLPATIKDSGSVLRATLELTPTGPIKGLRNDNAGLLFRGITADIGAKSPVISGVGGTIPIPTGATGVQSFDVGSIVATWFLTNAPPTAIFIGLTPEGGSFSLPEFFSSRDPAMTPRLRITYALPSRPGHP